MLVCLHVCLLVCVCHSLYTYIYVRVCVIVVHYCFIPTIILTVITIIILVIIMKCSASVHSVSHLTRHSCTALITHEQFVNTYTLFLTFILFHSSSFMYCMYFVLSYFVIAFVQFLFLF